MESYIKLFFDEELKEEMGDTYDFGRVFAGEKKIGKIYVYNNSNATYETIEFTPVKPVIKDEQTVYVEHDEVVVISAPGRLMAYEKGELILEYRPKIDIKKGLKGSKMEITAIEAWE